MKKARLVIAMLLVTGVSAFSETINISGKVIDTTTGLAIDSVKVTLVKQPAVTILTGANGAFTLSGTTAGILKGFVSGTLPRIRCFGPMVGFEVGLPTHVCVEAFNTQGRRVAKPFDRRVGPGAYRVPVARSLASQLLLVRVTCDREVRVFRMQGLLPHSTSSANDESGLKETSLLKVAASAVDTLVFSRGSYVTKQVAVTSYSPADSQRVALRLMLLPRGMRKIAGGTFSMGSAGTADSVHSVTVSTYFIDTTEVTQADYWAVMGKNPAVHSNNLKKPVENVTWFDAALYCNALSKREGFDTAYTFTSRRDSTSGACVALGGISVAGKKRGYRLPTVAEWEYAARGGSTAKFSWGEDSSADTIGKYAWFLGDLTADSTPQPVAGKKPNGYGLYDMAGNVWEWCTDEWAGYGSQAQTDPLVAPAATVNLKGGDYLDPPSTIAPGLHSSAKNAMAKQRPFFGFRVVITPVYSDTELSYMTMVGVTIAAAKDTQVNAWYDTTHIPLLMKYAGLKQAYRFKKLAPVDSLTPGRAGYWATYMYPTKNDIDGMKTSAEFTAAVTEMSNHWTAGECSTKVAVDYQKIKGWIKPDYTGPLNYLWIVRAEFTADKDAAVNDWYNGTHIPLILKYPGVKKIVRYKKIGSTGDINAASMNTYLAFYYFPAQADYDSLTVSKQWSAVQDNLNTETIDSDMKTGKSFRMQLIKSVVK